MVSSTPILEGFDAHQDIMRLITENNNRVPSSYFDHIADTELLSAIEIGQASSFSNNLQKTMTANLLATKPIPLKHRFI
jgi:hypothetical protein